MAEIESKAKSKPVKPAKGEKKPETAARPEKGDKPQQAQKAQKTPEKPDRPGKEAGEKAPQPQAAEERVVPRLKVHFEEVVRKKLTQEFGYKNRLQVPMIEKIVIKRSKNSYIRPLRSVTLHPIGWPSRTLKVAIDFRAFVITAF